MESFEVRGAEPLGIDQNEVPDASPGEHVDRRGARAAAPDDADGCGAEPPGGRGSHERQEALGGGDIFEVRFGRPSDEVLRSIADRGCRAQEAFADEVAEGADPGFEALAWNGLFAPAGTPAATVEKINADVNAVLKDSAVRASLAKQGLVVGGGSSAEFKSFIDKEAKTWGAIIKKNGITID